jgi:tetratricopeptide (TPR) repeat protein
VVGQTTAAAGGAQKTADQARKWFQEGQTAMQGGDLDAAEAAFRRVLAVDPRAAAAYSNLGVIAMRRQDWDRALQMLKKAAQLEPRVAGIRLNIGLVEYRRGNYAAAIAPLASVVRDQPDSQQARYLLGLCKYYSADFDGALRTLEPLWPQKSSDLAYLYVFCIAANNAGRKDLDEKALTQLIAVGTDTPEFHLILAKAYLNHKDYKDYDKVFSELNLALSAKPDLPFVHFYLGFAYMRTNQLDCAVEEFLKDISIEPDVPDNYEQLGMIYARLDRDADAEKTFHDAIQRDPRSAGSYFGLAKLYMKSQKYEEALRSIDVAVHLAPDNQNVHFLRGQLLKRMGRDDEARAEMAITKKILDSAIASDRAAVEEQRVPDPDKATEPQ